jgi:predicted nucleotide-binding protein
MKKQTKQIEKAEPTLTVSKGEAKKLLNDRINEGNKIKELSITDESELGNADKAYKKWSESNYDLLKKIFNSEDIAKEYKSAFTNLTTAPDSRSGNRLPTLLNNFHDTLSAKMDNLISIIENLKSVSIVVPTDKEEQPESTPEIIYMEEPPESPPDVIIKEVQSRSSTDNIKREEQPQPSKSNIKGNSVFIGYGRSKHWKRLKEFLEDELKLKTTSYGSELIFDDSNITKLDEDLKLAFFAIFILTAEDVTEDGKIRDRENFIYKMGLLQGRLGIKNVMVLRQDGVKELPNLTGIKYIKFSEDIIEQTFYEISRALKREKIIE